MEFRCESCGEVGVAAEVRAVSQGVALVCANCAHVNVAATSKAPNAESEATPETDGSVELDMTTAMPSVEGLIPVPGEGERCQKCAQLLDDEEAHCPQCGLSKEAAEKYAPGEAPWEMAPPGLEAQKEKADRAWRDWKLGDGAIDEFVDTVLDGGLIDYGLRKIQFYLVEHPQHPDAIKALQRLAEQLEMTIQIAHTQAEAQSEDFNDDIKVFRTRLMVGALIFWTTIFLLFSWLFFDVF